MKYLSHINNLIYYIKLKILKAYDFKLLAQIREYQKPYSYYWRYAYYCYKSNKTLLKNDDATVPISPMNEILFFKNLEFNAEDIRIFGGFGKYFQCFGHIKIGRGTYIANNVAIITSNHNFYNLKEHQEPKPITIGDNCWIGINSTILPGVHLGNNVIVGAGSVVTKSFGDKCIICGNPAKLLRKL